MTGPSIFVSAGEPSGDRHAAAVAAALTRAAPSVCLTGVGGPAMADAGVRLIHDIGSLQTIGIAEAVRAVPAHLRAYATIAHALRGRHCDVVLLVDYPGFHHRVALLAHRLGIPVLHYIAPQLWAWGAWRARRLRRSVDRLAVILPFERAFFHDRGIASTFVGHPLLDTPRPARGAARAARGIGAGDAVLGLFPGSRPGERRLLWPAFREAALALRRAHGMRVLVAADDPRTCPHHESLEADFAPAATVAAVADVAIAKSGTTTLELGLAGTPHVVAYRTHPVTYAVARRAVRVPWIGLVNLVLGRSVVPEAVQDAVSGPNLTRLVDPLLAAAAAARQQAAFIELQAQLGTPGAAQRVAGMALEMAA